MQMCVDLSTHVSDVNIHGQFTQLLPLALHVETSPKAMRFYPQFGQPLGDLYDPFEENKTNKNLYFIIFLTWLRAREKPTKKKKKVVVAIWCPIKHDFTT